MRNLYQILCGKGNIQQRGVLGNGGGGRSGEEKKSKVGRTKTYLSLTLVISMLKICKDNLKVVTEGICVLSWYMFSPDRKYLLGLANPRPLIQGQLFYSLSTSPYKLSCLNCEYRYLLLSQCIYPNYIFAYVCQEIKPKGSERK